MPDQVACSVQRLLNAPCRRWVGKQWCSTNEPNTVLEFRLYTRPCSRVGTGAQSTTGTHRREVIKPPIDVTRDERLKLGCTALHNDNFCH